MRLCLIVLLGLMPLWQKCSVVRPFLQVPTKGAFTVDLHHRVRLLIRANSNNRNIETYRDHRTTERYFEGEEEESYQRRNFILGVSAGLLVAPQISGATDLSIIRSGSSPLLPVPAITREFSWPLGKVAFSLLPLAGTSTRRVTVEETIVEGQIWTHDQLQGIVNVNVPVRQIVIRLSEQAGGGLWILNPVAPTPVRKNVYYSKILLFSLWFSFLSSLAYLVIIILLSCHNYLSLNILFLATNTHDA
jgi:hypothetical protein